MTPRQPDPPTTETVAQYAALVERMRRLTGRAAGMDLDQVTEEDVVEWLIRAAPSYTKRTFRLYKAALLHHCAKVAPSPAAREARDRLAAVTDAIALKRSVRVATKKKSAPVADLEKLGEYMLRRRIGAKPGDANSGIPASDIKANNLAFRWLLAGQYTGLRPSEWLNAQIGNHEGRPHLLVGNAKATQGRTFGPTRLLDLSPLPAKRIGFLKDLMKELQGYQREGRFQAVMADCRKALWRANRALWPHRKRHITLYSGRHQFSANAKSRMTKDEVAALLGHRSVRTAALHYGYASDALDRFFLPVPSEANIEKVRALNEGKTPLTPWRGRQSKSGGTGDDTRNTKGTS
ncbi:site-specific integrase [Roseomonas genomospecies 6]|uniref:Site-specific integrase n=1 Tax=Roseomonas genomospecies 6 TaxID=214106 RepID=A0A9W7KQG9_9PROT|nr:site-specific integrase [Roseomonas genomospecies 6]KAA0677605.1 site-specific integrase [Roseomonas genomospecies 6]